MIPNDNPELANPLTHPLQRPRDSPPRLHKENISTALVHSHPLDSPETPIPLPGTTARTGTCYPSESTALPERYQAALHHIHCLQSDNTKLYHDNCRLVSAVNTLTDRLAFASAPQSAQVLRLSEMQDKLRASEENRAMINKKYQDLLHVTSTGTGSPHHHVYVELQAVHDAHVSLDRDHRALRDKYARLKAFVDMSLISTQQTTRGPVPVVRSELRASDQSLNNSALPTAVMSAANSIFPDQKASPSQRRCSAERIMTQPSLRSAPSSVPTTWLAPLPTPPPSTPLPASQLSPTVFPIHVTVSSVPLPLPPSPNVPMTHDPRSLSGLPSMTQPRHLIGQDASEQPKTATHLRQRCEVVTDASKNELVPCGEPFSAPAPLESSPSRPPKRPSSELLTSSSPGGERKKTRIEGENLQLLATNVDTHPVDNVSLPSTDPHIDYKSSASDLDVQSYRECVEILFEKDADIENGVFCSLCFDRHQANMIPEPPDVLVQPDFDLLVKHCMTVHPAVWDDLRHKL